jgi:single-strand DNA-binding protein
MNAQTPRALDHLRSGKEKNRHNPTLLLTENRKLSTFRTLAKNVNGFNKWIGLGNLVADPQRRTTAGGAGFVTFIMAINERWKSEGVSNQATTFVPVVTIGKLAENVALYLKKGRQVLVEGKLHIETYEDKNQIKHNRASIRADRIEFIGNHEGASPEVPKQPHTAETT